MGNRNQSDPKENFNITSLAFGRSIEIIRKVFVQYPWYCSLLFISTVVAGALPVITICMSKTLIDVVSQYYAEGAEPALSKSIIFWIIVISLSLFLEIILKRLNNNIFTRLSFLITFDIQEHVLQHCINMDHANYDLPENQNILFRAYVDSSTASEQLFINLFKVLDKITTMFFSLLALFLFNSWLCLLAMSIAIPNFIVNVKLAVKNYKVSMQRSECVRRAHYFSNLIIFPEFALDNLIYNTGNHFLKKWAIRQKKIYADNMALKNAEDISECFIGILSSVGLFIAYMTIIFWSIASKSVGTLVMNIGLFRNANGQVQGITTDIANLYKNIVFLNDYDRLLGFESAINNNFGSKALPERIESIIFDNVTFKYPGSDEFTLKKLSFEICSNECICICGPNGAGKSTIIKLLLRVYDPQEGKIRINGKDIKEFDPISLRAIFSVLLQDFNRYSLNVKENVSVGKLEEKLSHQKLNRLLKTVQLKEKVDNFPQGSDTTLGKNFGDGQTLSQGEWQKIALARVFFRNASILVLDEPSSSLDPLAQSEILENFADITRSGISIIVTHRLSTVQMADRILVVKKGQVAEFGSHEELIEEGGVYEKMFSNQAKIYQFDRSESTNFAGKTSLRN